MKFKEVPKILDDDRVFINDTYQVNVKYLDSQEMNGWIWLSIKRFDKQVINDWRIMQQIKNAIAGEEREGVELYPAESRLVDTSNQFHIFVMPKGDKFPFGYKERIIVEGHTSEESDGSCQRPFSEGESPKDTKKISEVLELSREFIKKFGEKNEL